MPAPSPADETVLLLRQAAAGDIASRDRLLEMHRGRLRRMVAVRMDRRLHKRVDPSDIIQETFIIASRRLEDYLREQPLPFYPWLRQLAWDQLIAVHRRHLRAGRRAQSREEVAFHELSDESVGELAARLVDETADPLRRLVRSELQARVRRAIERLPETDREILVLRHLEHLSLAEAAAVLAIGESAAKMRHLRAVERLRKLLGDLATGGGQ